MAETKTFLSLNGLQRYDEKIKAFIKSQDKDVTDKLMALIGAAEEGNEKTILARVKDLEKAVGNVKDLPKEVQNLVAAILGESTRAKAAEETLGNRLNTIEGEGEGSVKKALADAKTYADGKDAAIAANKSAIDAVKADYLTSTDKTELTNTINTNKGILDAVKEDVDTFFANADLTAQAKDTLKEIQEYINSDVTAAAEMTASIKKNSDAISALDTKVGAIPEDATATDVVSYVDEKVAKEETRTTEAIKTAVEALDADLSQTAGADGLALHITEVDGKITAISGSIAENTYDARGAAKAVQGETTATVKALEDALNAITPISDSDIDALFATVNA